MNFDSTVGIIAATRLPIGKINGVFQNISPENLYQNLIDQQFSKIPNLSKESIDQIILGNVTNQGGNIARRCALQAGFSPSTPAFTIESQCGSGLTALITAANYIKSHDAKLICSGGVESTSTANIIIDKATKQTINRFKMAPAPYNDLDMGIIADLTAKKLGISRYQQDLYALKSHQKATQAIINHQLSSEIVPYQSETLSITKDQSVRFASSLSALTKLPSCFSSFGTVSAGNSCPISDGASSLVLAHSSMNFDFQGYYLGQITVGMAPEDFLWGPVRATQKLLKDNGLQISDIEAFELNEAFAVQALLFQQYFELNDTKLNRFGGALAYGHPYGATGGILVARLLNRLNQINHPCLGIATLCVAGGMGISVLLANKWWKK